MKGKILPRIMSLALMLCLVLFLSMLANELSSTSAHSIPASQPNSSDPTPTATPTPTGGAQKIAFVSDRDGRPQIYVMNSDGSNQTHLPTEGSGGGPRWSPDGTRLLFLSRFPGEDISISVMYRDGSTVVTLLKDYHDGGLMNDLGDPVWSRDGPLIV